MNSKNTILFKHNINYYQKYEKIYKRYYWWKKEIGKN